MLTRFQGDGTACTIPAFSEIEGADGMLRFAARVVDRALDAVAAKITPMVAAKLAPVVESELNLRLKAHIEEVRRQSLRQTSGAGPTQDEVDMFRWWHTFTFPNGVTAHGTKDLGLLEAEAELAFRIPVAGKTVLDVGANNGYFSVEAVRRGAKRVSALEKEAWDGSGFEQFNIVRRYLAPEIEPIHRDVMDLCSELDEKYDCILFLGVLYHLKHPLYVLEILADLTKEHLVVETHIEADRGRPSMVFYPGSELNADASNWWGPSVECVVEMLKTAGFARVEHVLHPRAPDRGFFYAFK